MSGYASGTQRAASTKRLKEMIATLDGFSAEEEDGLWFVSRPYDGRKGRRQLLVGWSAEGDTATTGIAAGQQPADDAWTLPCVLLLDDEAAMTPEDAEIAVEEAYNAVADLLATPGGDRLVLDGEAGPDGVSGAMARNPSIRCDHAAGSAPSATCSFAITLTCPIRRNRP